MNVVMIGSGYVGLVSGACFAEFGANVTCVDKDEHKINALLKGEIPIYEPGLDDLVARNVEAGRLEFTTDVKEGVDHGLFQFIAVGTPPDEDGSADLQHVHVRLHSRALGDGAAGERLVELDRPAGVRAGAQPSEHEVGVDRRGELSTLAVARGPRVGTRPVRPDREQAGGIDGRRINLAKPMISTGSGTPEDARRVEVSVSR